MNQAAEPSRWSLRHAWQAEADLGALALCRQHLAGVGVALTDAGPAETPDVIKMHGMEIADALAGDAQVLHDLSGVAIPNRWHERLPPLVRRFMIHGERWHGIPMGIHRSNVAWINTAAAQSIEPQTLVHPRALVTWLERARRRVRTPLAVGAQPWQVGVLFESILLGAAGPGAYRRAFEQRRAAAWREPAVVQAVDCLMSLREFADDDCLGLDWASQLDRVRHGEAALQVMGDWARATGTTGLQEWPVPGTAAFFVAVVDFFVPLARASHPVADRAALALTEPAFQQGYAQRKGCMPAVHEACAGVDRQRASLLAHGDAVLPSMTFDQCCSVRDKQTLLETLARHFVERRGTDACVRALIELSR